MGYVLKAVLSSAQHPEYGQITVPFPIPDEKYDRMIELLEPLEIGDALRQDCRVDELDSFYTVLNRLVGSLVNFDELDYLAKRLDSFDDGEAAQFQGMACKLGVSNIKDFINLTFCCQQATVITDFSDLDAIGRQHYMTMQGGGCRIEELERLDGRKFALDLILNHLEGRITPYGVVYDNGMKLEQLYEGKAKKVFATSDPNVVIVSYKDDATAFNGLKKGTITGKGAINNRMTNNLMRRLEEKGVPTHYVEELSDRETAVKKVSIVPLEVIIRNISAGSFAKRFGVEEGIVFDAPTIEFSYKNDDLGDPLMNSYHALALKLATQEEIDLIALCVMAEAEGEPEEGQRLVIDTILNRVDDPRFPDNVHDVIYQKNQFAGMYGERIERCYVKEELVQLVREELENRTNSEVVFFRTSHYHSYGVPLFQVGAHYFSSYE